MKTIVYVDGLNLFFGSLKGTSYKWLDLNRFFVALLPQNEIIKIKYYSAYVSAQPDDPNRPTRQEIYFRALRTLPNIEIILGEFHTMEKNCILAGYNPNTPKYAKVIVTQEKRTDVNIATHLVNDAHKKMFDIAVVVTNDSDLLEPIRLVQKLGLKVGLVNPQKHTSQILAKNVTFIKQVRKGALEDCQFPDHLEDSTGPFSKPIGW